MKNSILNYLVIAVVVVLTAFSGCRKDDDDNVGNNGNGGNNGGGTTVEDNIFKQNPPKSGDVYVVGYEGRFATVWKNSEYFASTSENSIGTVNSIYISGKEVYMVGSLKSETSEQSGVFWKNGEPDENAYGNDLRSVFVWNDNVYIAGNNRVYKNKEQILYDQYAMFNSVFVFYGDAYVVSGHTLWKNGTREDLEIIYEGNYYGTSGNLNSVYVSGSGDVYVAGKGYIIGLQVACFWENGVFQKLSDNKKGEANSVVVSDNNVYIAGYEGGYEGGYATLWKNGIAQKLSSVESNANCVFVVGNDVYVVGYEQVAPNRNKAVLWKNGVAQYLTDGVLDAKAMSIFVVK